MKGEGRRPSPGPDRCPTRTRSGPQTPAHPPRYRGAATHTSRRGADRAGFQRPRSDREIVAPAPSRHREAEERFRLAVLEKNPCVGSRAWRKKACRQAAHTDVESFGLEDLSKCGGGAKIAPISMPFDGHAVPGPGAHFACQDGGLVAHDPERLGKIPQVSPRL